MTRLVYRFNMRPPPTLSSKFKGDQRIYAYKEWKRNSCIHVIDQLQALHGYYDCIDGTVRIHITARPKDRRFRGLDAWYKSCLDVMQEVTLIANDSQVISLHIDRLDPPHDTREPTPYMEVEIIKWPIELAEAATAAPDLPAVPVP